MKGFELSNLLVIFFEPNCTSQVQPLDAGMIQTAKALYRKRQITWVLRQIADTPIGVAPQLKCNVRQAMEWFMQALREVPAETVKNCWIKTGILSPAQNADLSTGVRHNNRVACDERVGLPASIVEDLSALLMDMGKKVSSTSIPIAMASLAELVDMHSEREVFDTPSSTCQVSEAVGDDEDDDGDLLCQIEDDVDVDEIDPLPPFTLDEVKVAMDRVYEFVCIHKPFVQRAGRSNLRDYAKDADALRDAITSMNVTSHTVQPMITSFFNAQHD
jgi:hypothetical protein